MRQAARVLLAACALLLHAASHAMPAIQATPGMPPVSVRQVEAAISPAPEPPADSAGWQPVTLPDRWEHTRPGFGGTVWYRFAVRFGAAPSQPWALLLPKATMNADLWINGQLAGRIGSMEDGRLTRHWNTPLLFDTPGSAWAAGENVVHLRVKAEVGHLGGLAPPVLGPAAAVARLHERTTWWRNTVVSVCNVFVVSLGLFVFFVWTRHRQQVQYGYFSVAAVLWGLANSNMSVVHVPMPDAQWELLVHVVTLWALLLLCLFGMRFVGRGNARLETAVIAYALLGTVLHAWGGDRWRAATNAVLLLPVLLLGAWAMLLMLRYIRRQRLRDHAIFATAALCTLGIGAHDWLLKAGLLPFEQPYALPYVAPLLLSTLGWLIAGDYARTQKDLAVLNRELAERVRLREAELRDSFERLADVEREHAVAAERARILRDMHDGVGAHLTTAMRQLESGRAEPLAVAQALRDSLDQLKLSIDAMHMPPGDVNALLASLRYRLQPRIEAAGLALGWDVAPLPHWPAGDGDAAMRHLQFLLFEAISNALQHAGASRLLLQATADDSAIHVALSDDGRGFNGDPARALRTMRERAQALKAELRVEPAAPGTRVCLALPLATGERRELDVR